MVPGGSSHQSGSYQLDGYLREPKHWQTQPNSQAPTFLELATEPGMTITALSVALTTPHAGMPISYQLDGYLREPKHWRTQ
jgi:hypothetical protein